MIKLRNSLYVMNDAYIHKQNDTILMEITDKQGNKSKEQLPIHGIAHLHLFGHCTVSPYFMQMCAENNTTISYYNPQGKFLARCVGKTSGNVLLRQAQYKAAEENPLAIAQHLITAKVRSSRAMLQRHQRNHGKHSDLTDVIDRMAQIVEAIPAQNDLEKLRGLEGEAASHYFRVFNHLLTRKTSELQLNGRTRRPPKDPINAMLSFLYSVLGNEIAGALEGVGLDPQVGFLHRPRPGRNSLALDLLEEFRSYIVDRVVINLVNLQQVKANDFEIDTMGGVLLKDDTRKVLLKAYKSRKMEEITHPVLEEKVQIGLLPHCQAMLLARHLRGDMQHYVPFFTR